MNATHSRRRFLGVLSAGAAATVAPAALAATLAPASATASSALAPALAAPSPDAGLLELFDQYMATNAEYRRLRAIYERGRDKHRAKHPMPDVMQVRPGDDDLGLPEVPDGLGWPGSYVCRMHHGELVHWRGGQSFPYEPLCDAGRARAEEIVKANKKWSPKYWRGPAPLRSIERQAERARKLSDKLRARIDRTRARTVAGLAVKAQVAAIEGEDDTQFADYTLASILRDMRALGGVQS